MWLLTSSNIPNVWGNTFGLTRALLATSTLLTLLFNNTDILFTPGVGLTKCPSCVGITKLSLYCIFIEHLEAVRVVSILVLIITILGWRPAITGIFHWWVCFSLNTTSLIIDGGDQVAAVLSLLILPICLTDFRVSHWDPVDVDYKLNNNFFFQIRCFIAYISYIIIRYQVALIYFESVISKFKVTEWLDGTVTYYWFLNPYMGVDSFLKDIFLYLFTNSYVVTATTWGSLFLEFFLFTGLFLERKYRVPLYLLGLFFHALIAVLFGLIPFFFSMAACLTIYLYPIGSNLPMKIYSKIKNECHRLYGDRH